VPHYPRRDLDKSWQFALTKAGSSASTFVSSFAAGMMCLQQARRGECLPPGAGRAEKWLLQDGLVPGDEKGDPWMKPPVILH